MILSPIGLMASSGIQIKSSRLLSKKRGEMAQRGIFYSELYKVATSERFKGLVSKETIVLTICSDQRSPSFCSSCLEGVSF